MPPIEFAGRWSLLRPVIEPDPQEANPGKHNGNRRVPPFDGSKEQAVTDYARVLLRRYGVVFRRLLEREPFPVSWYALGRVYRRLEARGEIRGGHFVGGVSGEQFALPEAVGMLRSMRNPNKSAGTEWTVICGADPLNLIGILTPGAKVSAHAGNRILFHHGRPLAALEAGQIKQFDLHPTIAGHEIEHRLKVGTLPVALRPYYA